tara:strand:- start:827 stop:1210 length:384 start_codon:yes stop_codon:yes gene_type:complete
MSAAQFIKLFETVGIPVLTAAAAGYALWWLLKWITTTFKANLEEQYKELDEEIRDTRVTLSKDMGKLEVILIRLIDRIRVLEINFIEHDETVRTTYGLTKINRKKTRHDVVEELKEQIKDAGKVNGE